MAKSNSSGGKSAAILEMYKKNPKVKVQEIMSTLAARGTPVSKNLVYLVKGNLQGAQSHRRKVHKSATRVAEATGNANAVKTILKVKALANEVGGLDTLKALVEALSS